MLDRPLRFLLRHLNRQWQASRVDVDKLTALALGSLRHRRLVALHATPAQDLLVQLERRERRALGLLHSPYYGSVSLLLQGGFSFRWQ